MRPIGIHVRLYKGLQDVLQAVEALQLDVVQSFLITESNEYIAISNSLIHDFVQAKKKYNFMYFVHAAYWSGLHDVRSKMFASLKQETSIAQDLQSDGIVIHVGAGKAGMSQKDKALYVVECINELTALYPNVNLLLENSPHAGRNFGGSLEDFGLLMHHIEKKDQVRFCIDTAHAFVFGYDLAKEKSLQDFLLVTQELIGQQHIALLHFNDAADRCGSYIDKHEVPGRGHIGKPALQNFMNDSLFKDTPLIMEVSNSNHDQLSHIIQEVKSWDV